MRLCICCVISKCILKILHHYCSNLVFSQKCLSSEISCWFIIWLLFLRKRFSLSSLYTDKSASNLTGKYIFKVKNYGEKWAQLVSFCCLYPSNTYLFKVNNRNTRKRCEVCSKLTIKTTTTSGTSFKCFYR